MTEGGPDRPVYQCPRCLSTDFVSDREAMRHYLARQCEEKRCPQCNHPLGCQAPGVLEAMRAALEDALRENAALKGIFTGPTWSISVATAYNTPPSPLNDGD